MMYELVANGIDLFLANQASQVTVSESPVEPGMIVVADDGPGLPYDQQAPTGASMAETWFTEMHNSPTADDHSPHIHLNSNGVGLVVVAALSRYLQVVTHRAGWRWEHTFEAGRPTSKPTRTRTRGRGTELSFLPDGDVLHATAPDWGRVRRRLFDAAHLFPGIRLGVRQEIFHAPGGLMDLAEFSAGFQQWNLPEPRTLQLAEDSSEARIVLAAYGTADTCQWRSWCNGTETSLHGTHVDGFRDALKRVKWTPAAAIIHIIMTQPRFATPTRSKVVTAEIRKLVRDAASRALKAQ